jgi:hypothetical protein
MTRGIWIKQGSTWQSVQAYYNVPVTGWKPIVAAWQNIGGTWQQFYPESGGQLWEQPGNYTVTVPPGVFFMTAYAAGGGGGGGGGTNRDDRGPFGGGGGGGSAQLVSKTFKVTPGTTLYINVGAGGAGGATRDGPYSPGNPGLVGGDSIISTVSETLIKALGGGGGAPSDTSAAPGGISGSARGNAVGLIISGGQYGQPSRVIPDGGNQGGVGAAGYTDYAGTLGSLGQGGIGTDGPYQDSLSSQGYGGAGSGGGADYSQSYAPDHPRDVNGSTGQRGFVAVTWGGAALLALPGGFVAR